MVNVPPVFAQAGLSIIAAQTPAGVMNVGLTGDFNLAKLKPIDDIGKLAAIRRLIAGPEAQKEKEENRIILQNVVFSIMAEKNIDKEKVLVKSNFDTENIRVQQAFANLKTNNKLILAAGTTSEADVYMKATSLEMIERIHDALIMYLCSLISEEETEKIPLSDFIIGKGVPAWVYTRFALMKLELHQDKPYWSLFFKQSMEKSITFTLREVMNSEIREAMEGFPGFNDLVQYCEHVKEHFPEKEGDDNKIKFLILPRGLEYDLILNDLSGARAFVDTTTFKDYSFLWNTSRLGMLGISNPYGDRYALYKSYFGIEIEPDDEKASFKDEVKKIGPKYVPELCYAPTKVRIQGFFQNVGIPARLSDLVDYLGPGLFPGPLTERPEEEVKLNPEWKEKFPPTSRSPIAIGDKKTLYPERVIRYKRIKRTYLDLATVERNSDRFREFEKTPYFQKNLTLKVSISRPRDGGAALTKKALGCVKIVAKTEAVRYLAPAIQNFLSGFSVQEIMDLAADDIVNRLRAKEYLAYDDEIEGFEIPDEENEPFDYGSI